MRSTDDGWDAQRRSEAPLERADRNFAELLQEVRVLLVGVQILFGFLLTAAFNPRFVVLDAFQHAVHVITLLAGATSSALLVGPVACAACCSRAASNRNWCAASTSRPASPWPASG